MRKLFFRIIVAVFPLLIIIGAIRVGVFQCDTFLPDYKILMVWFGSFPNLAEEIRKIAVEFDLIRELLLSDSEFAFLTLPPIIFSGGVLSFVDSFVLWLNAVIEIIPNFVNNFITNFSVIVDVIFMVINDLIDLLFIPFQVLEWLFEIFHL